MCPPREATRQRNWYSRLISRKLGRSLRAHITDNGVLRAVTLEANPDYDA
jgi:hypothetical protein